MTQPADRQTRKLRPREIFWTIPKDALFEFFADSAFSYSAAVAFYTMMSLAPLMILVLSITSVFAETGSLRTQIISQIRVVVGPEGARVVSNVIENAEKSREGKSATTIGIIVLFLGATAVFAQLQAALNQIWGVQTRPESYLVGFLITRVVAFGVVVAIGFLLLASLILTSLITAVSNILPLGLFPQFRLWEILDFTASVVITTALFALLFRYVPDVSISWHNVSIGAFVTAVLFTIGKFAIGRYLGASSLRSVYGAAGSLVVLLFWVYYSSLILFFGSELSQVYTRRIGAKLVPRRFSFLVKKTGDSQETARSPSPEAEREQREGENE